MQLSLRAKKQHQLLGRLLVKQMPDLAKELLAQYAPQETVITDHQLMPDLFRAFLQSAASFAGSRSISQRTFIAAMIHVYQPELTQQPSDAMIIKRGFVKQLSEVLGQKRPNISTMIRQVIIWEQSYDDFREKVSSFSTFIIEQYGQSNTQENYRPATGQPEHQQG